MTPGILNWLAEIKHHVLPKPSILEIGSRNCNGTPRRVFREFTEYVGTDMVAGRGVDIVISSHDLLTLFKDRTFELVICCETLEHDNKPWLTIQNMQALVADGQILIVTAPTNGFPEHKYPKDYWRFMPDAFQDVVFEGFKILDLRTVPDIVGDLCICGIGRKNG